MSVTVELDPEAGLATAAGQLERRREFYFWSPDRFVPLTTAQLEVAARL